MKWLWRALAIVFALIAIAFIVMRVPDTDSETMRAKYGAAPSQFVELEDGTTVHLRDEGPRGAPAIVLLHGSNADLHTWQPWVEGLRGDYRVIRYDQIGHGLTGPTPDGDYSRDAFVADVDAVADALALDSFVLAGNSMGGGIAMAYAIARPDRLDGLVLVDAAGAPIEREGSGNLLFTLARIPGVNALIGSVTPRSLVEKSLRQSVSNEEIVTPEAVDRYWELARYPGNRVATMERFSLPREPFDADAVERVGVPTLVMWGEEDSLIPFDAAHWYAERLPSARLVSYPGIGHLPMEEAPRRSLADLRDWLEQLDLPQNEAREAGTRR